MTDKNKPKTSSKRLNKGSQSKRTVKIHTEDGEVEVPENLADMVKSVQHKLNVQKTNSRNMQKSVKPLTTRHDIAQKYDKSKIVFSSREYDNGYNGVEIKGWRRLDDVELKEVAQVDPYISAIIANRCGQAAVIGRPSDSKFDKGTRVMEIQPANLDDYETKEEFLRVQDARKMQMTTILKWIMNCGTSNKEIVDEIFREADPMFKICNFADFVSAQIRNLLTFGRMGSQIFRNEDGLPIAFRPAPIETIYPVLTGEDIYVGEGDETAEQSKEDVEEYNQIDPDERPQGWVQRVDGRNVNFFTEQDMKVSYFQKQALFDLRGYPLAPIEQAIYMVFIHQNTLGYLKNQFVKGLGTKGVLSIKSTDPAAELSDEDVDDLRRDFHNFLSRTDNSATTPVISGPVEVNWIPLASTPRDMEFLQIEEHVIRALCAAFQTSPQEMGYGHLGISGSGGLTQSNKQEEIVRGEERGLRMVLDIIYDHINEILYDNFPEAEKLFRVTYVGVGEDTRDAAINRHMQEMQTTATMSSLYSDSEKNEPIPDGGNVPLAPLFHQNVVRYMKYGDFMENFFGKEGWSKLEKYDFIIDPGLNQAYQENKMFSDEMRHEQGELQIETQAVQIEGMQEQNEAMKAQMQAGMQQAAPGAEEGGMPQEGAPPSEEGAPPSEEDSPPQEQLAQSLEQAYRERAGKLSKSEYFEKWDKFSKYFGESNQKKLTKSGK